VSERVRGLAAALLLGLLAAGCAQEGKLIDVPLAVRGVAYDQVQIADTSTITRFFSTRFKIQVHGANTCETSRVLLELSRVGPLTAPLYVIRPVARYNADDPCVNGGNVEGDTTMTLIVNAFGVPFGGTIPFVVRNNEGPEFPVAVDTSMHVPVPATMRFRIRVEDRTTASAVVGATVALDSLSIVGGGEGPIGSAITDALGLATFDVASSVPVGVNAFRYRVTVTSGTNTQVMPVRDAPARGQSIERVYVRI
jgi:hypothetical protein